MGWECPACTFFNRSTDYLQCECCGSERPSPAKARRNPAPGQRRRTRQQAAADQSDDLLEIDLLTSDDDEEGQQRGPQRERQQKEQQQQHHQQRQQEQQSRQPLPPPPLPPSPPPHEREQGQQHQQHKQDQEQQRPIQHSDRGQEASGGMGAGGSKASGGVAVVHSPLGTSARGWADDTWDDDFQIQLSESLATTMRQLQQPGTGSVHKQAPWADAKGAAGVVPPAVDQPLPQQQQEQPQEQLLKPASADAVVDVDLTMEELAEPPLQPKKKRAKTAKGAAAVAGAAGDLRVAAPPQQQQQQPGSPRLGEQGSGSSAHTAVVDADAVDAARAAAAEADTPVPPNKKLRLARVAQPAAADAVSGGEGETWALRTLRRAAKHAVEQVPAGKQAAEGEPSIAQQPPTSDVPSGLQLPLQPSLLLGKRPRGAPHLPLQPAAALPLLRPPSLLLNSPDAQHAQHWQQAQPVNPTLRLPPRRHSPGGSWPASRSPGASPQLGSSPETIQHSPDAAVGAEAVQQEQQQQQQGQREQQQQQGQSGMGLETWQQCVAALYEVAPPPAQQTQQAQQAVQQLPMPPAAPLPPWVLRARQGPDITSALVAAVADCPPAAPPDSWRQQRREERGPAPVQGWLAYRVAGLLPQSAACQHAADVLQVGAAAAVAAAAANPHAGDDLELQQAGGQPANAGSQQQQQQSVQQPGQQLDLSQLAARLLAGLTMQEEPYADLAERSLHYFNHRSSALHRKLRRHLAPALGGSAAGGSGRPPAPSGRRPSRLRAAGGAAGAGATARRFPGVRLTAEGRYAACTSVRGEQLWLGTYADMEAAARALDLAMVYRWLGNGRPAERPAFNLPGNRYLEDAALLQQLSSLQGSEELKAHVKRACGACHPNWGQR